MVVVCHTLTESGIYRHAEGIYRMQYRQDIVLVARIVVVQQHIILLIQSSHWDSILLAVEIWQVSMLEIDGLIQCLWCGKLHHHIVDYACIHIARDSVNKHRICGD